MRISNKQFGLVLVLCLLALLFRGNNYCAAYQLTPEGERLYKQWTEVIGYSAAELVKEMDPAPEITPGLVITPRNVKDYPGIEKLLPATIYNRLADPNHFLPIEKITICETKPRYYPQPVIDGTKECVENVRLDPETQMIDGYKYGLPFPRVTDPVQLVWNQLMATVSFEDQTLFNPLSLITYNKSRKKDHVIKGQLGKYRVVGRLFNDFDANRVSKTFKGTGIFEHSNLLMTYPADIKGNAFLRTRYWDIEKPDLFIGYIPGIKRIRTLSGSDAQDPLFGAEWTWDMWALEWQKAPSKTIFPNEYSILSKRIILLPTIPDSPALDIRGEQIFAEWEKRPVWVLEIKSLDPSYYYSKRVLYIGMEHFKALYGDFYDRRGKLWRWGLRFDFSLPDGQCAWTGASIANYDNLRHSIIKMHSYPNPPLEPGMFDMRWLVRMAR